jgi:hypothetical protein
LAWNAWTNFRNKYGRGVLSKLSSNAFDLVSAVTTALAQITQTTSLVQTPGTYSPLVASINPPSYSSAASGTQITYTVNLFWNGTAMPTTQVINLSAAFPLQNYYFDNANITVTLAPTVACGYCGDGWVNFPESCEPSLSGACCSLNCTFNSGVVCNNATKLRFVPITTNWYNPTGIDYYQPNNTLILSVNYPTGTPNTFNNLWSDGSQTQYSTVNGTQDYVRFATVRPGNPAGFVAGDLFVGTNVEGEISKISNNGNRVISKWCSLGAVGSARALYIDRSKDFAIGGKLVAVTSKGYIFIMGTNDTNCLSVNQLANVGVKLDGALVVSTEPGRWGGLSGKVITGNSDAGKIFSVGLDKVVASYVIGQPVGDLDYITKTENWYGISVALGKIIGVEAKEWTPLDGGIAVTTKIGGQTTGVFELYWDFTLNQAYARQILPTDDSPINPTGTNWEHSTFGNVGIQELLPPSYSLCLRLLNGSK